jgi:CheY-like chemotaxis protein
VIVLDLGLPELSGHAVREEIAAHAALRHVPIVVVTGSPIGYIQGTACVLRKPVTPDDLVQTVKRCIAEGADRV